MCQIERRRNKQRVNELKPVRPIRDGLNDKSVESVFLEKNKFKIMVNVTCDHYIVVCNCDHNMAVCKCDHDIAVRNTSKCEEERSYDNAI